MKKPVHIRRQIRFISYMMILIIGLGQPCFAMAEEAVELPADDTETIQYITAFAELAEEDAYFPCMYKPMLEELLGVFPETLFAQIEGNDAPVQVSVTWECEENFDDTMLSAYLFYPKWDETVYGIADSVVDSIEIPYIVVEVPADNGMISDLEGARSSLQDILKTKSILALVYLCDKYEVKQNPSSDSAVIDTVVCGQSVQITDAGLDEEGFVWYQVLFYQNGTAYTGYVEREFLATSDEDFKEWEESNLNLSAMPMVMAYSAEYPDIEQFPASYQNALYALKEKHPNWIFVRMDTGLDWNTVIAKEMGDKSLVPTSSSGSWQNGVYGQGWSYASEGILKYYIDPRNFLTDPSIFQFEQLTYNSSYHTTNAVQEILKSSFMASTIPGDSQTYAQAFTGIGQSLGISPFHLASRVLQEQGSKGTSMLISGTYAGYEGYYNYFNVGASGKTNALVIQSGLKKAVEMGWNTRYKSLYGGASVIGANYILKGQDTLYLEKFNVSNGQHANFTHQYMQNIQAPSSEASSIRKAYNNAGALENSFVFKIPVYNNMPASACSKPEVTDAITLDKTTISGLEVNKTTTLIPYVNGSKVDYISNMTFSSSNTAVASVDAQGRITAISPGTATISCTRSGANTASCTVTVVKADPAVSTPVISPIEYREGLKLSDIVLPDGWVWEKESTEIAVGTFSYSALYTPTDTIKYNTVTKNISFTVTKSIPVCRVPENLKGKSGDTLGSIVLPDGFVWESNPETELLKAGEYTFYASYNPNENNYYTVSHIPIIVRVTESGTGGNSSTGSTSGGSSTTGSTTGGNSSSGSTSGGSSSTGSTTGGNSSSGSTSGGSSSTGSTTGGNSSSGSTSGGNSSSGSTTEGNSSTGSTTGGSSTTGSTTGGNSSTGSTSGGNSSTGSTTGGNSSTGSTSGGSSTTGSTSGGSSTTGSTTGGSSSSGSTTGGNSSTGSTTGGSSSTGSTTGGSSSSGSTSGGNSSSGSTSGGSSSTGSTTAGSSSTGSTIGGSGSNGSTTGGNSSTGSITSGSSSVGGTTGGNASIGNDSSNITAGNNTSGGNISPGNGSNTNQTTVAAGGGAADDNVISNPSGSTNGNDHTSGSTAGTEVIAENTPGSSAETLITPQMTVIEQNSEEENNFFKPAVTIQMEDTSILTPEKLQTAKEQNFDILLDMGDYVSWSIDIDSVNMETLTEVDMGVMMRTENIPRELIAAILNGNKYIEITLAHNGLFGFSPILNVALNPENSGRYANLFYYDPESEALEFICDAIIDTRGFASFKLEHASSYVIIVSDYSMSGVLIEDEENKPAVNLIIIGVFIFMVIVVAGYAVFFYCRKRRERYEEEFEDDEDLEETEEFEDDEDLEELEEFEDDEDLEEAGEFEDDEDLEEAEEFEDDEASEEAEESESSEGIKSGESGDNKDFADAEEVEERAGFKAVEGFKEDEFSEQEGADEDDWIEDQDWHEPETPKIKSIDRFADDHSEDDWIDDDEWDIGNDWMDDEEWEQKNKKL